MLASVAGNGVLPRCKRVLLVTSSSCSPCAYDGCHLGL